VSRLSAYLRERAAADVARLDRVERIRLALRLGDDDLRLHREATGLPADAARRRLQAARRVGRRPSRAADVQSNARAVSPAARRSSCPAAAIWAQILAAP
jgi:hypothetical protein